MTDSRLSSPDAQTDRPVSDPDVDLPLPSSVPLLSTGLRHVWGPVIWAAVSTHEPRQLVM